MQGKATIATENANTFFDKLRNVQFSPNNRYEDSWADIDGLNRLMEMALASGNGTDIATYLSPTNYGYNHRTGCAEIARILCSSTVSKKQKNNTAPPEVFGREPDKRPPVIALANVLTVSSQDALQSGGSHWVSWVLLPKRYVNLQGQPVNNDKNILYFFDGLNSHSKPENLVEILTRGVEFQTISDEGTPTEQTNYFIVSPFCRPDELEVIDLSALAYGNQSNMSDCGWWACYYALMTIYTGSIAFMDEIKKKKFSALPLRRLMAIEEPVNEERIQSTEFGIDQHGRQLFFSKRQQYIAQIAPTRNKVASVDIDEPLDLKELSTFIQTLRSENLERIQAKEEDVKSQIKENDAWLQEALLGYKDKQKRHHEIVEREKVLRAEETLLKAKIAGLELIFTQGDALPGVNTAANSDPTKQKEINDANLDAMIDGLLSGATLTAIDVAVKRDGEKDKSKLGMQKDQMELEREKENEKRWTKSLAGCQKEEDSLQKQISKQDEVIAKVTSELPAHVDKLKLGNNNKENKKTELEKQDKMLKQEKSSLKAAKDKLQTDRAEYEKAFNAGVEMTINFHKSAAQKARENFDRWKQELETSRDDSLRGIDGRFNEAKDMYNRSLSKALDDIVLEHARKTADHIVAHERHLPNYGSKLGHAHHTWVYSQIYRNSPVFMEKIWNPILVSVWQPKLARLEADFEGHRKVVRDNFDNELARIAGRRKTKVDSALGEIKKIEDSRDKNLRTGLSEIQNKFDISKGTHEKAIENCENERVKIKNAIREIEAEMNKEETTINKLKDDKESALQEKSKLIASKAANDKIWKIFKARHENCKLKIKSLEANILAQRSKAPMAKTVMAAPLQSNDISVEELADVQKDLKERRIRLKALQTEIAELEREKQRLVLPQGNESIRPLNAALLKGRFDIAKMLIDKGADPNLQDEQGWTALHCLIVMLNSSNEKQLRELLASLFQHGANLNVPNNQDMLPQQLAVSEDYVKMLMSTAEENQTKSSNLISVKM